MRATDGMRFDSCIGLLAKGDDGKVFDADGLTCYDKPLSPREQILVSGRRYLYLGDDSIGNSIFVPQEPFPEPETIELAYKDNLFVVLEIYAMKNGHFYAWPYVQSGATSSNNYTRQYFRFEGEFETREAAVEAAWVAGKERIDTLCAPAY
jgi:hypothetical protein